MVREIFNQVEQRRVTNRKVSCREIFSHHQVITCREGYSLSFMYLSSALLVEQDTRYLSSACCQLATLPLHGHCLAADFLVVDLGCGWLQLYATKI